MNQQRMEYQVKGTVKYDLFFEEKKKSFMLHSAFELLTRCPYTKIINYRNQ